MSFSFSSIPMNVDNHIRTYSDLLNKNQIDVLYHEKTGFSAYVHHLDSNGHILSSTSALPLQGLPKEITRLKEIREIKRFFRETYFIPEKGVDGLYNRVAVHIPALGGGKFKIPFQPGLALGSIIKGDTLEKMENYAKIEAQRDALAEQMKAAEQQIEILQGKIASKKSSSPTTTASSSITKESPNANSSAKDKPKSGADILINLWNNQMTSLEKMIIALAKKIEESKFEEIPIFEGFHQGIESPIDINRSRLDVKPRGFDSLNYSSQYIDMKQSISEIDDQVKHSSSANDVSISGGAWIFKGKVSHAWSEATSQRLAQIKQENTSKGVLMINAMVTTRHVRYFSDLHFDKAKLKMILNVMKDGGHDAWNRYGITTRQEDSKTVKEIYLLTEAVLGGSFTALVIFLDEEKKKRALEKEAEEHGHTTSVKLSGKYLFAKGSANFSHSDHSGSQSEEDLLNNISNTNIAIEITAQGGIPIFTRDVIEHEVMKHLDVNPAKFELSPQDEAEAENFDKLGEKEKLVAAYKRQMKMENAQIAVMNTYRGLTATKDKQTVHTAKSVMEAYENFADKIVSDPNCGIPIGFNYQVLTESRLKEILAELEGPKSTSQIKQEAKGESFEKDAKKD